jgi:hypothetical protein
MEAHALRCTQGWRTMHECLQQQQHQQRWCSVRAARPFEWTTQTALLSSAAAATAVRATLKGTQYCSRYKRYAQKAATHTVTDLAARAIRMLALPATAARTVALQCRMRALPARYSRAQRLFAHCCGAAAA